jgi:ribosome biogenesis GTPase
VTDLSTATGVDEAEAPCALAEGLREGIVLRASSGLYTVQPCDTTDSNPGAIGCNLRGNLKKVFTYNTSANAGRRVTAARRAMTKDPVAVGDRVRFTQLNSTSGVIEEILPRQSTFARSTFGGIAQTLVTNIDQLVVVFACAEPRPDLWLLDRWTVAAEQYGLPLLIVANKDDLIDDATFEERFSGYRDIGYTVLRTSARAGRGIDTLQEAFSGRISAITGPSGVGKSSLLNAVQPGLSLATGAIGEVTPKGRHTTTVRELIPLESGGWVADTPGLRQLDLLPMDRSDVLDCFIDLRQVVEEPCRFHNCRHEAEPDCRLKEAVESGSILRRRYESFLILARELERSARN